MNNGLLPGNSWTSGDKIYVAVARNDATNCETVGHPRSIGFSAVPSVSVASANNGATVTPTVTASLASMGSCSTFSGVNNVLILTFTNSGTILAGTTADAFGRTYAAEITISGVSYITSGDPTDLGPITVANNYNLTPKFTTSVSGIFHDELDATLNQNQGNGVAGVPPGPLSGPSNADIEINQVTVVANKPSTTLQVNVTSTGSSATNDAISPVTIKESSAGALGGGVTGFACFLLAPVPGQTAEWNPSTSPPVATLGGGLGTGTVPVTVATTGTQTGSATLEFQIKTASSGTPGTVTLSGLAINFVTTGANLPLLKGNLVYGATNAACSNGTPSPSNPVTLANVAGRTFGQTQDATAAQVFEQHPPNCFAGIPGKASQPRLQQYWSPTRATRMPCPRAIWPATWGRVS